MNLADARVPDEDGIDTGQLALLPAPEPAPRLFVEQPVQDVLRLARPVVTRYATAEVL